MTSRRSPHQLDSSFIQGPCRSEVVTGSASSTRMQKAIALMLHAGGLALFYAVVVMPVASPLATGELAREFKPLLDAWIAWSAGVR
jgi:hypothetical protein